MQEGIPGINPRPTPDEFIFRVVLDGLPADAFARYLKDHLAFTNSGSVGIRLAGKALIIDALKQQGYLPDTFDWYRE